MRNVIKQSEASLHQQVVDYIKLQYPNVLFRTDFAAGIKMTIGQAVKHKKLQKCKAWPDIFIATRRGGNAGLFIELKTDVHQVYNKKMDIKKGHPTEQLNVLEQLYNEGYAASFVYGFDNAKRIIDEYLKLP